LNAAASGDVILVAPGVYNENLFWPPVDGIRLIAEQGPEMTTIDAGGAGRPISIQVPLTSATLIQGFCITGGHLTSGDRRHGAGILIDAGAACSPTIRNNHIVGNLADGPLWNFGGGIYIDGLPSPFGSTSRPLIVGNRIEKNRVENGSWNYGAGVYTGLGASPTLLGNTIVENRAGGGSRGYGGGIHVSDATDPLIASNIIAGNLCQAGIWNHGAGIYLGSNATARILGNTIVGNRCIGGTLAFDLILGGGIHADNAGTVSIYNNIVCANDPDGITADARFGQRPIADFNDVWGNVSANHRFVTPGANSISADPMFAPGDPGRLLATSPCLDAGSNALMPTPISTDVHGDPRWLDGDTDGGSGNGATVDIGADEYTPASMSAAAPPQLGTTVPLTVAGPSGSFFGLLVATTTGNVFVAPYGQYLLGGNAVILATGSTTAAVPVPLPNLPGLAGTLLHFQAIVDVGGGAGFLTNRVDWTMF
jgi:hypothetical protein